MFFYLIKKFQQNIQTLKRKPTKRKNNELL